MSILTHFKGNSSIRLKLFSHDVNGEFMRVSTLSMFLKGVMPKWEDPANKEGGEY